MIEIYSSSTDSTLEHFTPLTSADVADQVIRVSPTGTGLREFFILRTAGVHSGVAVSYTHLEVPLYRI